MIKKNIIIINKINNCKKSFNEIQIQYLNIFKFININLFLNKIKNFTYQYYILI